MIHFADSLIKTTLKTGHNLVRENAEEHSRQSQEKLLRTKCKKVFVRGG